MFDVRRSTFGWFLVAVGWCLVVARPGSGAEEMAALASRFAKPPAEARILKIIHGWPDESAAQNRLIEQLGGQGFGGVVCNVSFAEYLESEARWGAFVRAVRAAREAGLALWLYDERGYPSGNAGGLVLRDHPEWEARGLLVADQECGPGPVTLAIPPGRRVLCAALPLEDKRARVGKRVDLAAQVQDGQLRWEAPPGRWLVLAMTEDRLFDGTHAELNLAAKMPYVNLLEREPTARFLEVTHGRYAQHLGDDLGKSFVATFTDEPSLMSVFLKRMPYRPLPWAPGLATEFRKRRGYALEPVLPDLVVETDGDEARHRYDFWLTVSELVAENFFGQIQAWCRQHGLPSGGHLLAEENIVDHVPLYGDFFRCMRRLDSPGIDCLTSLPSTVPWHIARLASSAAELDGNTLVMCETSDHSQRYRPPGDRRPKQDVTQAEIRGTCNRLFVGGINVLTSYYSFAGLSEDALRRLNEWVGRCCTMLRGGHQVADVAVVYPVESIWTKFVPARLWSGASPGANRIENVYRTALDSLYTARRDLVVVDSATLVAAKVDAGTLKHRDLAWRVIVLPGVDTLPLAAWENLASFVLEGGVVIGLGARPLNSESEFPSAQVGRLAEAIFGPPSSEVRTQVNAAGGAGVFLPLGAESLLPLALEALLEPDVKCREQRAPVRATHRRIDSHEVYFLINDSSRPWEGEVEFCATGRGEQWDPANGTRAELELGPATLVRLEPYGGMLFRFPAVRLPKRHPARAGQLPNLAVSRLPEVAPELSHGEFVAGELEVDQERTIPGKKVWRAKASLKRGNVDTFLFLRLPYAAPLDLGGAECLEIETWVPDTQRSLASLLVMLKEQGGGDFLAVTSRSLGAPGYERVIVPLSRFQLAGWSKDGDGRLDVSRVAEVRLGWGGYLGAEGERVEFSAALPQVIRPAVAD